jgi:hypothetical protein
MKRTFFKTPEAATDYTLADLADKETRRNLVQQTPRQRWGAEDDEATA